MTTWITDDVGNRCSVEYWYSEKEARKALESNKNCTGCSDCSNCSNCSDCSYCAGCSDCSNCSSCKGCLDCSQCTYCSRCSHCSGCSDCRHCSHCSDCSHIAHAVRKILQTDSGATQQGLGLPSVPRVKNIHRAVYAAASAPMALKMSSWHSCGKTHCWAGWVIFLAGESGRELEAFYDTPLAAMKIYAASDPGFKISPCRFFDDSDAALAEMNRLAEERR